MLEVCLLGKFELKYKNQPIDIPSRPAQSLFAYLILSAGTSHRREKLAGLLWPDSPEETARENLRHALWRMRKALEGTSSIRFIHADDVAISFKESPEYWLDAAELKTLSETADADELIAALSNYQGELLPGFYDEWAGWEREHLYSIFEHQMARLMSLLQEENRWLDILDWAERWIKLGQKPEPAYRALMMAHATKGDMSKVAATYQRCMKSLKEFGVEPSKETHALYQRLKAGKEILETGPAMLVRDKREVPKTNLPVPLTSFIGREREIEEVKRLLSSARLLTLTGTGGIGKTRLAIQAGHEMLRSYKDGVWWVELAPLIDEALVPQAVAQVLGVRESPGQSLVESVKNFLREKQLLLILDNCEHLIAACAQLADKLLTQCANLRVLTTSRETLGITGETTLNVPALSFPVLEHLSQIQNLKEFESIQLFVERAAAVRPDLALTQQNAFTVTQICHRLDGIPLALELAAARVKILSLEEIAARLDDRFTLLTHGSRTALPRHQTLRALIDWSHDLLSAPERVLWRRLSVFIGGWTLHAAESVCGGNGLIPGQVLELLSRLVDKSLVIVDERDGTGRYRMLETIRQYGQEKLQAAGESDQIPTRHLECFLQLAEQAQPKLLTAEQKTVFAELDAEYGNLRSALEWATETDAVKALRLAVALSQFWEVRGYIGEGRIAIEQALQQAPDAPKRVRATGLRWRAQFAGRQADYARVKEPIEESLNLWRELGDKRGLANSFGILGDTCLLQADYEAARVAYEEGLALFQEIGDKRGIASMMTNLGNVANSTGDYATARQHQEASTAIFRELGDKLGLVIALNNLGVVAEQQGDNFAARRFYEESISAAHELGEKNMVAYALNSLAHVVYLQGNPVDAQRYYRESLAVCQEIGEKRAIAYCLEGFAKIAARSGNAAQAAHLLGAAEALRQAIGAPLSGTERSELDQDVIVTRNQLGKRIFETAWAEGSAMTMDQAAEYALKET